ncbi:MAG: permease [Terrimicrobiaceae bacterium]|nr:permease [Terrimicrobiaceae bacterium]
MGGAFHFNFSDFSFAFLSILLEGAPFLLLGTMIAGLIDQFLPVRLMTRLLPRNPYCGALVSGLLGIIFPMCECGVVPIIRRLMAKGLPPSNAITYMLAAPIVNPIVAFSTYSAFRGQAPLDVTLLRLSIGFGIAAIVGMAVHHLPLRHVLRPQVIADIAQPQGLAGGGAQGGIGARLWGALAVCVGDFLNMAVYFVFGAAAAALFNTSVNQEIILPLATHGWLATVSLMGLAATLSLCSTTDAFIAATFVMFPTVSKLAFLVFGPMVNFKLILLYSSVFRNRFVLGLTAGIFAAVVVVCMRLKVLAL